MVHYYIHLRRLVSGEGIVMLGGVCVSVCVPSRGCMLHRAAAARHISPGSESNTLSSLIMLLHCGP